LRYELPGLRGRFYRLGCRLKQIRQPGVSAVGSGQRPVLARNDPLGVFGDQRQQSLPVAAADRGEEVLLRSGCSSQCSWKFLHFARIGSRSIRSVHRGSAGGHVVFISRT
jgi:hypothetical protein